MSVEEMEELRKAVLLDVPDLSQKVDICPFCAGEAAVRRLLRQFYVSCNECGASGPTCDTVLHAVDKWETRYV